MIYSDSSTGIYNCDDLQLLNLHQDSQKGERIILWHLNTDGIPIRTRAARLPRLDPDQHSCVH